MTDADDVKRKIDVHEGLKNYVMELRKEGIECQGTDWYDRNGDILIVNPDEVTRAKEIIRKLKRKFHQ